MEFDGDAETITVSVTVSDATGESTEPIALLVLADSDDTGLDVVAKALLVASAPGTSGNSFYADSDRSGTDTPLDGELGLGADNTVISRFFRFSETIIALNDNNNPAALDIGAYFATDGDGEDLTLYFQTVADGEVSFSVSSQFDSGGGNNVRFTLPTDAQDLFDNLATGDRWIVKAARASVTEFTGDAEAIIVSVLVSDATGESTEPDYDGNAETINVSVSSAMLRVRQQNPTHLNLMETLKLSTLASRSVMQQGKQQQQ